jgi:putative nucleic acid binding protein
MAMIPCKECDHQISDRATGCPNCGAPVTRPKPKPLLGGVLAAVVLLACVGVAIWLMLPNTIRTQITSVSMDISPPGATSRGDTAGKVAATAPADALPPLYSTTAEQLYQDYNANGVATQNRIGNRRIRIAGNVTEIDEDAAGHPLVKLSTGNAPGAGAEFRLNDEQRAAAAELVKGQVIDIECAHMQHVAALPEGSGCALVPADTGSPQAYLAVAISEEKGQSPLYIVGPMPRATCETRSDAVSAQVAGNIPGAHIVSKLCTATAQENLPTNGCRLDTSMSALPDLPAAHLWKYECNMPDPSRPARVNTKESTRALRKVAVPVLQPVNETDTSDAGELPVVPPGFTALPAAANPAEPTASAPINVVAAHVDTLPAAAGPSSNAASVQNIPAPEASTASLANLASVSTSEPPADTSTTPSDLLSVKARDPGAADHIDSYCNKVTASAANRDAVAAGCRHDEVAAWNRLVVQNEFPALDDASRQKCSQAPFPDSYVAKEVCAKYQLRVN